MIFVSPIGSMPNDEFLISNQCSMMQFSLMSMIKKQLTVIRDRQ